MRTRVLNPKWIAAMQRHGYKGAFEMAATVDYLFGYDATAGVVEDWMYERVTEAYVADAARPEVLRRVEPVGPAGHRRAAARGGRAGPVAASSPECALDPARGGCLEARGWRRSGEPDRRCGPMLVYPLSAVVGHEDL